MENTRENFRGFSKECPKCAQKPTKITKYIWEFEHFNIKYKFFYIIKIYILKLLFKFTCMFRVSVWEELHDIVYENVVNSSYAKIIDSRENVTKVIFFLENKSLTRIFVNFRKTYKCIFMHFLK